jgi:predicted AAA+ superfamily ATPase
MAMDSPHIVEFVQKLLCASELPRDALPYTEEFAKLKNKYQEHTGSAITNYSFWKLISRIGKRGLKRAKRRKRALLSRQTSEWQKLEILRLFPDGIGSRDDLPYTKRFDELYRRFSLLTRTNFTKHEFWRAVSGVSKKSRKPKPVFEVAPLGGLLQDTVDILERNNPWWTGKPQKELPSVLRWAYREVYNRLNSGIAPIVALKGARQVGKTTIQQQFIDHLVRLDVINPKRILRVQFDDTPSLGVLKNPIEKIIKWYEKNILCESLNEASIAGKPAYLLFDEVQNLPQWSEQLKVIVDNSSAKVFVTGSSTLRIQREKDSLAGRLTLVELGPLRLSEITKLRSLKFIKPFSEPSKTNEWTDKSFWADLAAYGKKHVKLINEAFRYFSLYGGYPVCHKRNITIDMLAPQIVRDVVERSIVHDRVRGVAEEVVRALFELLCKHTGDKVGPQYLSQQINLRLGSSIGNREIRSALDYLEKTLLVRFLRPIQLLRKNNTGHPTICLCDHFIRYAVTRESIPLVPRELRVRDQAIATQAGHIIESVCGNFFSEFSGISTATFPGNNKEKEVDIVLSIGCQKIPIEIKYRNSFSKDDLEGLKSFCNKPQYEAPFGIVITQEKSGIVSDRIIAVPAKTILTLV